MKDAAMFISQIKSLQIDLVSTCNAKCPCCGRQDVVGNTHSNFPINKHLDISIFKKIINDPSMNGLEKVFLCGNFGDAMASPYLLEMIDIVNEKNQEIGFSLHTNAGLASKETWKKLGKKLNKKKRFITFAIDGLEDTNHIYRREVNFKTVIENAQTFIEAGGFAIWKFVEFEHNKHQTQEAHELSKKMGFKKFEIVPNYSPASEPFTNIPTLNTSETMHDYVEKFTIQQKTALNIKCDAKDAQSLFIDFEGDVWPCCWIANWKYSSSMTQRLLHQNYFKDVGQPGFNSLKHQSLTQVLKHPWFDSLLEQSWDKKLRGNCESTHKLCFEKCGTLK